MVFLRPCMVSAAGGLLVIPAPGDTCTEVLKVLFLA